MTISRMVLRRFLSMIWILIALTAIEFGLQKMSPIDAVKVLLGPNAPAAAQAAEARKLGLDRPLVAQYLSYLSGLLHGSFGISLRTGNSVTSDLRYTIPPTLELAILATVLAVIFGALLGLASGARWRGAGTLRGLMIAGASIPPFLLGLLGILIVSNKLGWLPSGGQSSYSDAPTGPTHLLVVDALLAGRWGVEWDALGHLIMPALCIALIPAVMIGRILRGSVLDNLGADYCKTAVSKGLARRQVLTRHVLRNSLGPAISMTGLQVGTVFAGIVVVEEIFSWPGLGSYLAQAIPANDFPAISAVTLILGACYVVSNALVDILQAVADPRIRR